MSCATESHAYVIFGATGNLAMAKLLPALFQLHCLGQLAPDVRILGCGRTAFTQQAWRGKLREHLQAADAGLLESFLQRLDYLTGSLEEAAFYQALDVWIGAGECGNNVIFYLSVSPELYVPVTVGLAEAGLLTERTGWRRTCAFSAVAEQLLPRKPGAASYENICKPQTPGCWRAFFGASTISLAASRKPLSIRRWMSG